MGNHERLKLDRRPHFFNGEKAAFFFAVRSNNAIGGVLPVGVDGVVQVGTYNGIVVVSP